MLYQVAAPIIQPRMRFYDTDGKPLVGGKVYSFKVGTELFKPTYRDAQRTALNTNPVVLDGDGSALIYLSGAHVLRVYDKNGNFIEVRYLPETQMRTQFFDKYGVPLKNGKVWTYDIASTIKKTSYADADKNQPNVNPVVLDADGWASISMVGSYRLRSYNENGVHLGDQDFKRPAAKALTSRIYPLFFDDSISSNKLMEDIKMIDALEFYESCLSIFSVDNSILSDLVNTVNAENESASTTFSAGNAEIREALNIVNADIETIRPSLSMSDSVLSNVVVTNQMEIHNISSSFAMGDASLES